MNNISHIRPKINEAPTNEKVSNHQKVSEYQVIFKKINLNITSGVKMSSVGVTTFFTVHSIAMKS